MTIDEIKKANRKAGYHFFDEANMLFFSSGIYCTIYPNLCFITSEQDTCVYAPIKAWGGKRRYTVRQFDPATGEFKDASEFGEFETLEQAMLAAPQYPIIGA